MDILVCGGSGQLGQSLRKVAEEYPHHNFVFTDMPDADITDPETIGKLIAEVKADVIVNCAAYTAVDKAEREPEEAKRINAAGPESLAGIAVNAGIPLVHISTDYVFNGTSAAPYKEGDPTGPTGVYGRTKLEGEKAVEASGARAAIIRTAWLYSEFGNNFVKTMLYLSETREEINVVADQTGTPTYAPDLARAIVKIIDDGISGCQIYHFSNEGQASWADFAEEIFRLAGRSVKVNRTTAAQYPTPANRPAYSVLDKTKIKASGVEVPQWQVSLAECIDELKHRGS